MGEIKGEHGGISAVMGEQGQQALEMNEKGGGSGQVRRRGVGTREGRRLQWGKPEKAAKGTFGRKETEAGWRTERLQVQRTAAGMEEGWDVAVCN